MRLRRAGPAPGALIALTPLIDVVFILLIFFMLATRFDLWGGFTLALAGAAMPSPAAAAVAEQDRTVVLIRLMAGDRIQAGGRQLAPGDLPGFVADELKSATDRTVAFAVRAETGTTVQALVALLEGLKAAGAGEVGLVPAAPGR